MTISRCLAVRPVATLLLIVMSLEACMHWVPTHQDVGATLRARPESRLRVTVDGSQHTVNLPQVDGAFLLGFRDRFTRKDSIRFAAGGRPLPPDTFAFRLTDIQSVEVSRVDGLRTSLLISTVVIAALLAAVASALRGMPSSLCCPSQ